jgi:hypothetical protein
MEHTCACLPLWPPGQTDLIARRVRRCCWKVACACSPRGVPSDEHTADPIRHAPYRSCRPPYPCLCPHSCPCPGLALVGTHPPCSLLLRQMTQAGDAYLPVSPHPSPFCSCSSPWSGSIAVKLEHVFRGVPPLSASIERYDLFSSAYLLPSDNFR